MSDWGLTVLVEVLDEVLLALELPGELLCIDIPERAFFRLCGCVGANHLFRFIIVKYIRQF